ncbi:delta-lactam-biosynthetic de-N-acetylase [Clostridium oryzae]|uniref:Peptidoglycan-N-acetylmuramic acid deacetylase PdaA n=1 Tax=Clostridium oryzae TaxID=1450648 RepID=A0A1V4IBY8_9CLOT|nr:delta-lactam-biosynthetic de-N-acetylase [Clostridium oryzae]OPJ57501.1 peptidoglycan-N-acetylmuramic acid deacetylase PdaA precursor [Clostridium oryzae]
MKFKILCSSLIPLILAVLLPNTNELNWYTIPNNNGVPPTMPGEIEELVKENSAYYVGDRTKKELYLTFDEGYENGYTSPVLDTLKKQNVKAAFFVVKPYIDTNKELVNRMAKEGHLVCNHSWHHPSMAKISDMDKFTSELREVENTYKETTGLEMPKFFRPPMGKYSELSLNYTKQLGYKTIFWSMAYFDWDVNKQPDKQQAMEKLLKRTHNGSIILLHTVSKTNAEILHELINKWKAEGYTFKTLNELP